ncbi:MAG: molybdopterin converting factor subunit 1 [Pyrinomonadaceae bacterium]|nr:molybdopterin converting factor subunit 1 [Pyrinomonadaceae bacterium]
MSKSDATAEEHTGEISLKVHVLFFGAAREEVGADESTLELAAPATVTTVFEAALESFPQLRRFGRSLLVAVNEEYKTADAEIRAGDEIAIFPPVSGGSTSANATNDRETIQSQDFFELTATPIDVGATARRIVPSQAGATVTLDGYVREWTRGRRTLYLVYEAYEAMAVSEMQRLGVEARRRFEIAHIGIVHRTGRLEIGETSVCVSVSAPHRHAAFEACEWAIRELKRTVPIWKKEFYEDGEVWVEGDADKENS